MNWNTPEMIEIALGAEINSYASAELDLDFDLDLELELDLELDESAPDSSSWRGSTADACAIPVASA